jgi:hypothetical protein
MTRIRCLALAVACAAAPVCAAQETDPWAPVRPLEGRWQGASAGEPGEGRSTRRYAFILEGQFLQGDTTVVYPPQAKNPKGETHRDLALFSYDRARKALVLRQFHVEGFVNTYVQEPSAEPGTVRFVSEAIENIPPGFRARETYRFTGRDEVTETFELAEPDGEFALYSQTRLKRIE